jgi:hypothetical protein
LAWLGLTTSLLLAAGAGAILGLVFDVYVLVLVNVAVLVGFAICSTGMGLGHALLVAFLASVSLQFGFACGMAILWLRPWDRSSTGRRAASGNPLRHRVRK